MCAVGYQLGSYINVNNFVSYIVLVYTAGACTMYVNVHVLLRILLT